MPEEDPYLDAGVRGYIVRTARSNAYRIAGSDVEDLIQEGYVCYYRCRNCYVGVPPTVRADGRPRRNLPATNPDAAARRHFMSLFKTALRNRLATLATRQSAYNEVPITDIATDDESLTRTWESVLPCEEETATVAVLLASAPREIKQLFALLVDDALALSGYRRYGKRRGLRKRETNNRYWCRVLGLPAGTDLSVAVEQHFLHS